MFPVGHVHKHDMLRWSEYIHIVLSISLSMLHGVHEAKAKMDLENSFGEWFWCLKHLHFLRKAAATTVVLIGA